MKPYCIVILLTFCYLSSSAQQTIDYSRIDKLMLAIPDSLTQSTAKIAAYTNSTFQLPQDKLRAIYVWVASNINYDIANMYAINLYQLPEETIAKALLTRKAICQGYAELMNDLCTKCNLKSNVIYGYTKQNGAVDFIPHAWIIAQVGDNCLLSDPTWGAGYVSNGKFVRKLNNTFFNTNPSELIKNHMPFDPIWQCLKIPYSNQDFKDGTKPATNTAADFNYADSIAYYEQQPLINQYESRARRITQNGVSNALIYNELAYLKREALVIRQNDQITKINAASATYNESMNLYNDFINYRNHQFTPKKSDAGIQQMLTDVTDKLKESRQYITEIKKPEQAIARNIMQITNSITEMEQHLQEQREFVDKYIHTPKMMRKSLFYKTTIYGIPVN